MACSSVMASPKKKIFYTLDNIVGDTASVFNQEMYIGYTAKLLPKNTSADTIFK